jgi:hypothetical protein
LAFSFARSRYAHEVGWAAIEASSDSIALAVFPSAMAVRASISSFDESDSFGPEEPPHPASEIASATLMTARNPLRRLFRNAVLPGADRPVMKFDPIMQLLLPL